MDDAVPSRLFPQGVALADRRLFLLNDTQWTAFMTALDAPARPMPRLERLLNEPSILDARDKPPL